MRERLTRPATLLLLIFCSMLLAFAATRVGARATQDAATADAQAVAQEAAAPGALEVLGADGRARAACPLRHTNVRAEISGFLSRVTVTQEFDNPFKEKIEAVYVFPLPSEAAVDDMTITVGGRTVRGKILRREEARAAYESARAAGQVAGLLDQERPNIFTQSVANIMPGERVTVKISYVETLKYEGGAYEFTFPMVVGPRYVPGESTGLRQGGGFAPDTDLVPDASRVTPPVARPATRAGHDISVEVALDAGVAVEELRSPSHEVEAERHGAGAAVVKLKNRSVIPNKDFVLRYGVAGRQISDALLTHRDERGGFFTLILQPPARVTVADVTPKELVFVLDTSGSMEGFPIEKAKEAMGHALDGLNPQDTFNLITFSGHTHVLFPAPVPATPANLAQAQAFLKSRRGRGGTEMMKAIRAALAPSNSQTHVRVVCFMTDGYVGNDFEIIGEVQKHPNARVFAFGIGGAVNRFLLDKMAEEGRGEVEYVSLSDDGSAAARRFHERVRSPVLTDISIDWGGLPVADLYPRRVPDLFGAKPVVVTGRYERGASGRVRLAGRMAGNHFEREITIALPEARAEHDVLATLWARARVGDLLAQDYAGAQRGAVRDDLKETITQLGLEYRLMTQYTSFVAVEEMTYTDGGVPRRVDVPVELPEGVSPLAVGEAGFVGQFWVGQRNQPTRTLLPNRSPAVGLSAQPGFAGTAPASQHYSRRTPISSGVVNSKAESLPAPQYPALAMQARASGAVRVQVAIDESGAVVSASVLDGHPLLQKAATDAALKAQFRPTLLSGRPVRTTGVLTYNFASPYAAPQVSADANEPTPEEQKRAELLAKLHPSLAALVIRLEKKEEAAGADEAKFVREGRAEVQVWLKEKTPEAVEELRKLGFEVVLDPRSSRMLVGRVPVERLASLAALDSVVYVAPQSAAGR